MILKGKAKVLTLFKILVLNIVSDLSTCYLNDNIVGILLGI